MRAIFRLHLKVERPVPACLTALHEQSERRRMAGATAHDQGCSPVSGRRCSYFMDCLLLCGNVGRQALWKFVVGEPFRDDPPIGGLVVCRFRV